MLRMLVMSSSGLRESTRRSAALPLGERAEVLVDAEHLRVVLGERHDDLHRRKSGVAHQLHLAVLEPAPG